MTKRLIMKDPNLTIKDVKGSILIDHLEYDLKEYATKREYNGMFLHAKPLGNQFLWYRIIGAIRVLLGKSFAVHYYDDIK